MLVKFGEKELGRSHSLLAQALVSFVDFFHVHEQDTRFSVVQMGEDHGILLNWYAGNTKKIHEAVSTPKKPRREDHMEKAIDQLITHSVKRKNVETHVIIFTDRQLDAGNKAEEIAAAMKDQGVKVYVVGTGDNVDDKEVKEMSSDPDAHFNLQVQDLTELQKAIIALAGRTCYGEKAQLAQPTFSVLLIRAHYAFHSCQTPAANPTSVSLARRDNSDTMECAVSSNLGSYVTVESQEPIL